MSFARVDDALQQCRRHLDRLGGADPQIEAILTSYVSTLIYAALEGEARRIVAKRGAGDGSDARLEGFAKQAALRLIRSIKIGELAGIAAYFAEECKRDFHSRLDAECKSAWDSIINNRHGVAHDPQTSAVSNLTFRELEDMYPKARLVLDHLEACLIATTGSDP